MTASSVPSREHFIPVRKTDLVRLVADKLSQSDGTRDQFLQLCRMLEATIHFEYHERLNQLKDAYAWFDPDADTQPTGSLTEVEREQQAEQLFQNLTSLLERANYVRVSHETIQLALGGASDWGLNLDVDLEVFDRLEVFVRGEAVQHRIRRRLRSLYRAQQVAVPVYQRLVVGYRARPHGELAEGVSANDVYLKVFKGIPKMDLEMLLPGTSVKMTLADRVQVLLPVLSGVTITAYKLFTGALALAVAGFYGLMTVLGLVGGSIGYGVKSYLGYLRAKEKYQSNLTRSLYYQNLDNNAGVLCRLLDEAEEQELRETILAYYLLLDQPERSGFTSEALDERAEGFLRDLLGVDVDFEVDDALSKLQRFRLIEYVSDGTLRAVPLPEALCRLDRAWDGIFDPAGTSFSISRHDRDDLGPPHIPSTMTPKGSLHTNPENTRAEDAA